MLISSNISQLLSFSFDETGCLIGVVNGSLVIVPAGISVAYVDDPENRGFVTSIECISAGGFMPLQ